MKCQVCNAEGATSPVTDIAAYGNVRVMEIGKNLGEKWVLCRRCREGVRRECLLFGHQPSLYHLIEERGSMQVWCRCGETVLGKMADFNPLGKWPKKKVTLSNSDVTRYNRHEEKFNMAKNFSVPTAIPARTLTASLAAVIQEDCMVDSITVTNNDVSDRTVTIKDANGKVFEPAYNVLAGTRQQIPLSQAGNPLQQGVFFSGGIQMSASVASMIDLWIAARTAA